jgi:hypothetical protein
MGFGPSQETETEHKRGQTDCSHAQKRVVTRELSMSDTYGWPNVIDK